MMTDGISCWYEIWNPVINTPANGASINHVIGMIFGADPYSCTMGWMSYQGTDYEIWTGPKGTGTNVFSFSNISTSCLVGIGTLTAGITYYCRIKYRGGGVNSGWSNDVMIIAT